MSDTPLIQGPDRLILDEGGTVERPEWGIDIVTAKFRCKASLVYRLIPEWGVGHPTWSALKKVSHRIAEPKGGWANLDVTYRGLIDGKLPPMKVESSVSLDSVQLSTSSLLDETGLSDFSADSAEYEYYSPSTSFEYYTTTKPKGPIHEGELEYIEEAFRIEKRSPAGVANPYLIGGESYLAATVRGGDGTPENNSRKYPIREGTFNGIINLLNTAYKATPVCKGIWFVTETTSARIQPYGLINRVHLVGLS